MFSFSRRIYLDYASAPPILTEAIRAMREAERFVGNPGAIHAEGVAAKRALEEARSRIAMLLGAKARELVFTSGLTEANNLAILGYARHVERTHRSLSGTHWIVSAIEHDSVLECFAEVERQGGTVSHANPDARGSITPQEVERLLKPKTVFVSVGWANNEIGVIQPLAKIAHVLRAHESAHKTAIAFHADAGQGPLYLPTVVHSLGVDFLSLGGNKLGGPHGIGALFVGGRSSLGDIPPVLLGGSQERGLRAGTESVALAVGFAAAFEHIARERESEAKRLRDMRDLLARELSTHIQGLVINGNVSSGGKHVLPHMLNVSIPGISSEYIVLALDRAGIAISKKSACREREETSHVVATLGGDEWRARNTLRISMGRDTRKKDIPRVADELGKAVETYRGFNR